MGMIKVHELRCNTNAELLNELTELSNKPYLLCVAVVAGGVPPNMLSMIKVVSLSIVHVGMVILQNTIAALREVYKNKLYLPLDLRPKKKEIYLKTPHQVPGIIEDRASLMRKYAFKV